MRFQTRALSNAPLEPDSDPALRPYRSILDRRRTLADQMEKKIIALAGSLENFALAHEYFGLHFADGQWVFREYAPHAESVTLAGDFSNWNNDESFRLHPVGNGVWEGRFPGGTMKHGMRYLMRVKWHNGGGERLPAYLRRAVQDEETKQFTAQIWEPEMPYQWRNQAPPSVAPLIYEAHVGIAQEKCGVGTFSEFTALLPEIAAKGYNTVQLMGVMEHPYYGSFGYHVSNFFAVSSRFGTPEDFKNLVDEAHGLGLRVIIDLVHSHAVKNDNEGLGRLDGRRETYFHSGCRGIHEAWDSLCFDYGKLPVLRFLLSNCRFFLEEYHVDGFRFDGVTSMLYRHHGLNRNFCSYDDYFGSDTDDDALVYLTLANRLIHRLNPQAQTIAEDVSGMPLLAEKSGAGFDFRMAMGVSDIWFKLLDIPDEHWSIGGLFAELINRRQDERVISYVECHDQAIVGGQSAFFRMAGAAVYDFMECKVSHSGIDRAVALHKMMRLATAAAAGHGYLNFIGNEFGHPEWVDLPREGNGWSCHYARRQWSLEKNPALRYAQLSRFDRMITEIVGSDGFYDRRVQLLKLDEAGKVLIFERGGFIFAFNFSASESFSDYCFEVPGGVYETVTDSDAEEYGGHSRRIPGQRYFTIPSPDGLKLSLYLPARSALVLKRHQSI